MIRAIWYLQIGALSQADAVLIFLSVTSLNKQAVTRLEFTLGEVGERSCDRMCN